MQRCRKADFIMGCRDAAYTLHTFCMHYWFVERRCIEVDKLWSVSVCLCGMISHNIEIGQFWLIPFDRNSSCFCILYFTSSGRQSRLLISPRHHRVEPQTKGSASRSQQATIVATRSKKQKVKQWKRDDDPFVVAACRKRATLMPPCADNAAIS